jgi:hypothetical protein
MDLEFTNTTTVWYPAFIGLREMDQIHNSDATVLIIEWNTHLLRAKYFVSFPDLPISDDRGKLGLCPARVEFLVLS